MQKKIVKQLALTACLACAALNTYAVGPGFYMGAMLGPSTNSASNQQVYLAPNSSTSVLASAENHQFGSRLFMGYQIGRYAGIEGGMAFFTTIEYKPKENVTLSKKGSAHIRDFDLVGKAILPFGNSFDVYGKGGIAVVYQTVSGSLYQSGDGSYKITFKPTFSVGASYALSQNWVTDISYNQILTGGVVKSVSFAALGISYHFVDVYCGQFLC